MFCNYCGSPLAAGVQFCTSCGKAVGPAGTGTPVAQAAPAPRSDTAGRVARHRNILGVLWLVRALMNLPGALVLVGISGMRNMPFSGPWGNPWGGMPQFLGPLLGSIGVALLLMTALSIVVGVGLLQTQSWGRILAIVMGIVSLISIPFGTALGIYTLWVLLPEECDREFAQMAQARARIN